MRQQQCVNKPPKP